MPKPVTTTRLMSPSRIEPPYASSSEASPVAIEPAFAPLLVRARDRAPARFDRAEPLLLKHFGDVCSGRAEKKRRPRARPDAAHGGEKSASVARRPSAKAGTSTLSAGVRPVDRRADRRLVDGVINGSAAASRQAKGEVVKRRFSSSHSFRGT
ncbi:MAG: hypothetical protein ACXW3X_01615 [Rhodoplanes sp.]